MTRGPRRLKDDPDFKWETGCNLSDEREVVDGFDASDHDRVKARVLAAVALAPLAPTVGDGVPNVAPTGQAASGGFASVAAPVVGGIGGALVLAVAYWLGVQAGSGDVRVTPAPAPIEAPAPLDVPAVAPGAADEAPVEAAPAADGAQASAIPLGAARATGDRPSAAAAPAVATAARTGDAASPELEAAVQSRTDGTADAEGVDPGGRSSAKAEASASRRSVDPSGLSAEIAEYDAANTALDGGDSTTALRLFDAYLAKHPTGAMRSEAMLGRLHALRASGDVGGTEALAAKLQDLPEFSGQRDEILRLRAESLVLLDRCDEATSLADQMSTRAGNEIRKVCRAARRE